MEQLNHPGYKKEEPESCALSRHLLLPPLPLRVHLLLNLHFQKLDSWLQLRINTL